MDFANFVPSFFCMLESVMTYITFAFSVSLCCLVNRYAFLGMVYLILLFVASSGLVPISRSVNCVQRYIIRL